MINIKQSFVLLFALLSVALFAIPCIAQDVGAYRYFEVKVVDTQGKPLPDASVDVTAGELEFPLSVDKDGVGSLNLPSDAKVLTLSVRCPGHISLEVRWQQSIPASFTFEMSPGEPIGGIVHDERGQPIAGVEVEGLLVSSRVAADGQVLPLIGGDLGTTDAAGKWCADVATKEPLELRLKLSHDNYFSDVSFGKRRLLDNELRTLEHVEVMNDLLAPQGIVRNGEGKPVADVDIYVVKQSEALLLENGRVLEGGPAADDRSTAEGKFQFADPEASFTALYLSDEGWALVPGKKFAKNVPVDVSLTEWGGVEGVLTESDKPAADKRLKLSVLGVEMHNRGNPVIWNNTATTNEKGEFVFERLTNGYAIFGRLVESCAATEHKQLDFANEAQCSVIPGETTSTQLNRQGLQVTGMIVPLRYDETEAVIACGMISLEKQDETGDVVRNLFFQWGKSTTVGMQFDPVKNAAALQKPPLPSYIAKIEADGSFSLGYVPPGSYQAKVKLWCEATDEVQAGWHAGNIWDAFPVTSADEKKKSVDLGLLEIEVYESAE